MIAYGKPPKRARNYENSSPFLFIEPGGTLLNQGQSSHHRIGHGLMHLDLVEIDGALGVFCAKGLGVEVESVLLEASEMLLDLEVKAEAMVGPLAGFRGIGADVRLDRKSVV